MTRGEKAGWMVFAAAVFILLFGGGMITSLRKPASADKKNVAVVRPTAEASTQKTTEFEGNVATGPISINSGAGDRIVYIVHIPHLGGMVRMDAEHGCPYLTTGQFVVVRPIADSHLYAYVRHAG